MAKNNRRSFIQKAGAITATAFFTSLEKPSCAKNLERALQDAQGISADTLAIEEEFWHYIQQSFTVSHGLINLDNGSPLKSYYYL